MEEKIEGFCVNLRLSFFYTIAIFLVLPQVGFGFIHKNSHKSFLEDSFRKSRKAHKVKLLWAKKLSSNAYFQPDFIKLKPVISQNILMQATSRGVVVGLKVQSGKQVWKRHFSEVFNSSTVHKGLCYLTTLSGKVYALQVKTGKLLWQSFISPVLLSQPYIYRQKIYTLDSDRVLHVLAQDNGSVIRRYAASLQYNFSRGKPVDIHIPSPLVYKGTIYITTSAGQLLALRFSKKRGGYRPIWEKSVQGLPLLRPYISKGKIFISTSKGLYTFSLSGKKVWSVKGSGFGSVRVFGNKVYVLSASRLLSFSFQRGKPIDSFPLKAGALSSLTQNFKNEIWTFGDHTGVIKFFNLKTQKIVGAWSSGGKLVSQFSTQDNLLFFFSKAGNLFALKLDI